MENRQDDGTSVPGYTPEFGIRLAEVIQRAGGLSAAAAVGEVTYETLGKWRDGKARPALFAIARICRAAGASLDWLMGGEAPIKLDISSTGVEVVAAPAGTSFAMPKVAQIAAVAAEATMEWLDANDLELTRPLKSKLIGKALQAVLPLPEGTSQREIKDEVTRVLNDGLGLLRS